MSLSCLSRTKPAALNALILARFTDFISASIIERELNLDIKQSIASFKQGTAKPLPLIEGERFIEIIAILFCRLNRTAATFS